MRASLQNRTINYIVDCKGVVHENISHIAVYTNIDFLDLILKSLHCQSFSDFEVIIAEDNNAIAMKEFITRQQEKYPFSIVHVSQTHDGFGKNRILNKAIEASQGEYLNFIDGDCVLHRHYLREYVKRVQKDLCLFGRRVIVDKKLTDQLITTRNLKTLSLWRILFSKSGRREDALLLPFKTSWKKAGIYGSSFFIAREKMIEINGFDEDFTHAYFGEDTDVERRLKLIGVKFICTQQKTIQYHLHHACGADSKNWEISQAIYEKKVRERLTICKNGLEKIEQIEEELLLDRVPELVP